MVIHTSVKGKGKHQSETSDTHTHSCFADKGVPSPERLTVNSGSVWSTYGACLRAHFAPQFTNKISTYLISLDPTACICIFNRLILL